MLAVGTLSTARRKLAGSWMCIGAYMLVALACTERLSTSKQRYTELRVDSVFARLANPDGGYAHLGAVEHVNSDLLLYVDGARLVRLDSTGRKVAEAARRGKGPGEWQYAIWAGPDQSGAGVVDVASFRFLRLSPTLAPVEDLRIPELVRGGAVVGRLWDGSLISLLDPPTIPGIGAQVNKTAVLHWIPGSMLVDTVATLSGTEVYIDPAEHMIVRVPGGRVDWAAVRDSVVVAGNGGDDTVLVKAGRRAARWVQLVGLPTQSRLSAARVKTFVDEQVSAVPDVDERRSMQRTYAKLSRPKLSPRFERLVVDAKGRIWCAVGGEADHRVWLAFTLSGALVDSIRLPVRTRPWLIDDNQIVASEVDEDGLHHLARYVWPHRP